MNNPQQIANLIKQSAKEKKISIKQLLEKSELNINTISELSKGKQISYVNFAKIADCLGVSVDYLLGKTDNPKNNIATGDISNSNIDHSMNIMASPAPAPDSTTKQFLDTFEELSLADKIKVISYAIELKNKE